MRPASYSVVDYGRMITCEPRMSSYAKALSHAIFPGAYVIDLGAGPGLFALLACQMGAGHVTAIEPDASIELARRAAAKNGFADRITFVRDLSTNHTPAEKADIVVSDIRGVMPFFEHHIPTIRDTRARLLKPDGILIPGKDRIFAALVEAQKTHDKYRKPWLENDYGIDLSAGYGHVINGWRRTYEQAEALLTEAQLFATLDYHMIEDTNHRAALRFAAARPGTAHGILMWFETELAPGIGFSNAPGEPEQIYGQAFFPLEHPVPLAEGTVAEADISASYINGDYVWSWSFRATDTQGRAHTYRQSSFKSAILAHETLAPRAATFRPPARKEVEVDVACLGMFDGQTPLSEIAQRLSDRFPDRFRDTSSAFDHIAGLSARYNRGKIS